MRLSQKANDCQLSPMRKFHPFAVDATARGVHILHLNIGQPDIETPAPFFDALRRFADPVVEYAPSPGISVLCDALIAYYAKHGIALEAGDVLITTGGSEALLIAMLCILDEGDEVILPEPFYPNYATFIRAAGGTIRPVTTLAEEGYHYAERARIESLINPKTRALLINSPGNPTGTVLSPAEMRLIMDIAVEHDLWLIADEVYREFAYETKTAASFASFRDAEERIITIDSVSKRFSACGARIGALITKNKELHQQALKFCQARLSVATIDQLAAAALYDVEPSYYEDVRCEYERRRDTIFREIRKIPGVVCHEPKGAFYMMAKLPVDNADAFQQFLLTDFSDNGQTVMFAPGDGFYATPGLGVDEIRIAYVLNCDELVRAAELLRLGLDVYNAARA